MGETAGWVIALVLAVFGLFVILEMLGHVVIHFVNAVRSTIRMRKR